MKKKTVFALLAGAALALAACGSVDGDTQNTQKEADTGAMKESTSEAGGVAESQTAVDSDGQDHSVADTEEDPTAQDGLAPASSEQSDPDERTQDPGSITVSSPEDAEQLLYVIFGTEDNDTGYPYSFGYLDTYTIDGQEYYGFTWRWMVDNDHLSRLTDLAVRTDGSAVYMGSFDGENWQLEPDNMLES